MVKVVLKKIISAFIMLLFYLPFVYTQTSPPFWSDIISFKKKDSIQLPSPNLILFVGSSSITRWDNVNDYFPGYTIINRGFGGSTLKDIIRYTYDIILPYHPKQIVIYCGENDIGLGDSAQTVVRNFRTLFGIIRENLPDAKIDFISIKPSPVRSHLFSGMKVVNAEIKKYLSGKSNADFIDLYDAMLDADGHPIEKLYIEDRLHLNHDGYVVWQKIILPYLIQ